MEQNKFSQLLYYFPYDLTFYGASDIWTLTYCGHNCDGSIGLEAPMWHTSVLIDEIGLEYAPILVPFDRLADYEIEIDSGKMWLCELLADFDNSLSRENFNANVQRTKNIAQTGQYSFNVMQLFFKYHVDVFGLIDLRLATDYFKFKN